MPERFYGFKKEFFREKIGPKGEKVYPIRRRKGDSRLDGSNPTGYGLKVGRYTDRSYSEFGRPVHVVDMSTGQRIDSALLFSGIIPRTAARKAVRSLESGPDGKPILKG